jgi:hypothetical protein
MVPFCRSYELLLQDADFAVVGAGKKTIFFQNKLVRLTMEKVHF